MHRLKFTDRVGHGVQYRDNRNSPIGVTDEVGLYYEITPPESKRISMLFTEIWHAFCSASSDWL